MSPEWRVPSRDVARTRQAVRRCRCSHRRERGAKFGAGVGGVRSILVKFLTIADCRGAGAAWVYHSCGVASGVEPAGADPPTEAETSRLTALSRGSEMESVST